MKFEMLRTTIPGCYEIIPNVFEDRRGSFIKTFHRQMFAQHGLEIQFAEDFFSVSNRHVLRGLHFQLPPRNHVKIVYCTVGSVLDIVLDLRVGSPTFKQFEIFDLNNSRANMIYISSGLAHGFYVTSEIAIMMYKVSIEYSPDHDAGIHWNSLNIPWPDRDVIISERDNNFVSLAEFQSPFIYEGTQ